MKLFFCISGSQTDSQREAIPDGPSLMLMPPMQNLNLSTLNLLQRARLDWK